jgi:predicted transposase YdaD
MTKPFDTTTKQLLESAPSSWLAYIGLTPEGPVRVIDADLATVIAEADKVFRIDGPNPYLVHIEMQAGPDPSLPRRLWRYSALLDCKQDVSDRSTPVLDFGVTH